MSAAVARKKRHFATGQRAEHVGIRRRAERRLQRHFVDIGKAGHGVQTTPTDYSDLRLQRIHLKDGVQTIDYTKVNEKAWRRLLRSESSAKQHGHVRTLHRSQRPIHRVDEEVGKYPDANRSCRG